MDSPHVAKLNQAIGFLKADDIDSAIPLLDELGALADAAPRIRAEALFNRMIASVMRSDVDGAAQAMVALRMIEGLTPEETEHYARQSTALLDQLRGAEISPEEYLERFLEESLSQIDSPSGDPISDWFAAMMVLKFGQVGDATRQCAQKLAAANTPPLERRHSRSLFEAGIHGLNKQMYYHAIICFEELCRPERPVTKYTAKGLNHLAFARWQCGFAEEAREAVAQLFVLPKAAGAEHRAAAMLQKRMDAHDRLEAGRRLLSEDDSPGAVAQLQPILDDEEGHPMDRFSAANLLLKAGGLSPGLRAKAEHFANPAAMSARGRAPAPEEKTSWLKKLFGG